MNLWQLIKKEYNGEIPIQSFRELNGFNQRLGSWGAVTDNSRYFKSLLREHSKFLDRQILESSNLPNGLCGFLKNIKNRQLGNPISIKYKDMDVDIDYLLSVEEMFFLHNTLDESETILEIGAGFGRLAHSILQNFSTIKKYYLVDIDFMLDLQKEFLSNVLSKNELEKIEYISIKNYQQLNNIDLTINIDSFQEMPEEIILEYLKFISKKSKSFFSRNAVCKYHPSLIDITSFNQKQFDSAMGMGLSRKVVDIYDDADLEIARIEHIKAYCPKSFEVAKTLDFFGQYHYYHLVLYQRINE